MRGKSGLSNAGLIWPTGASMRPAHYAREVSSVAVQLAKQCRMASMRPAHYAREVS